MTLAEARDAAEQAVAEHGAVQVRRLYPDGDCWVAVLGFPIEERDGRRVRPVKRVELGGRG